jgi:hypothetical protein
LLVIKIVDVECVRRDIVLDIYISKTVSLVAYYESVALQYLHGKTSSSLLWNLWLVIPSVWKKGFIYTLIEPNLPLISEVLEMEHKLLPSCGF